MDITFWFSEKERLTYQFDNIFDVLPNFPFATSEMMHAYYL